jgi:hypothetical protein
MYRPNRGCSVAALACVAIWCVAANVLAAGVDPRLLLRLDPRTARDVQAEVDRAQAEGVPTEPLVLKALEGAAKGAPGEKIVAAVRRNARAIGDASRALGPETTEAELLAGAGAILAGAPPDSLRSLRAARGDSSLVVPLVVISDLLARRVPAPEASGLVVASCREGMSATALLRMREWIHHDILEGVAPSVAASRAWVSFERKEEPRWSSDPARPPTFPQPRAGEK